MPVGRCLLRWRACTRVDCCKPVHAATMQLLLRCIGMPAGMFPAPPPEFNTCLGDLYSVAFLENRCA